MACGGFGNDETELFVEKAHGVGRVITVAVIEVRVMASPEGVGAREDAGGAFCACNAFGSGGVREGVREVDGVGCGSVKEAIEKVACVAMRANGGGDESHVVGDDAVHDGVA